MYHSWIDIATKIINLADVLFADVELDCKSENCVVLLDLIGDVL